MAHEIAYSTPPCKDCTERYIACHDHCKKYAEWKVVQQKEKALYEEYKLRRREDFLRSEQCQAQKQAFINSKNNWRRGKNGR